MADIIRSWSIAQEDGKTTYKYTYTENNGSDTLKVVISGLSRGVNTANNYDVDEDGESEIYGIYINTANNTVEISSALLSEGTTVSLDTSGTGATSYTLTFNSDVVTEDKAEQKYGWVTAGTSATYYLYNYNYYKLNGGGTSISYVDASSATGTAGTSVAWIDNLDFGTLSAGSYSSINGITVKKLGNGYNSGEIELTSAIVGSTSSTVHDVYTGTEKGGSVVDYTIALSDPGDGDQDVANDGKVGFQKSNYWSFGNVVGSLSKTGTYTEATAAGWAVSGTNTINYTGASSVNLLSLSGLATVAVSSALTVGTGTNKYVTLGDGAIGTTTIQLNVLADGRENYSDYNLAFANPSEHETRYKVGAVDISYMSAANGSYSATRFQITGSGFELNGQSATYAEENTKTFFTITGLSSDKDLTVSATKDGDGKYVVTLGQSALGSASVYLNDTTGDDYNYKLALGAGVKDTAKGANYFSITPGGGNGTAVTYQFDTTRGWALSTGSDSIVNYTAATEHNGLFSLSGLSSSVSLGGNSLIAGITFTENELGGDSKNYIVTLGQSVLGSQSVYLNDLNTGDNINYSLSLAADVLQEQKPSNDFVINNDGTSSAVTYRLHKTDAWNVVGDSVMYTSASLSNNLFTLEGLSNNLTTGTLSALAGITVTKASVSGASTYYTVMLDNSVLGGMSVQLIDADPSDNYYFSLSLAANVTAPATIDLDGKHWDVETAGTSSTATYHYFSQAGYSIVGDSAVYYTKNEHPFITIEGLSAGLTAAALSAGITFAEGTSAISLSRAVLGTNTVSITDEDNADSANYVLDLDSDATIGSVSDATINYVRSADKVYVKGYLEDYYTLNGTSQVKYTNRDAKTGNLLEVTGLKIENNKLTGASVDSANKTITLSAGALSSGSGVSLVAIAGGRSFYGNFSFSFAGGISATQIYEYKDKVWTVQSTSASFSQEVLNGHKLSANGESVIYDSTPVDTAVFMTLTGISAGAASTAISEQGGKIYLADAAIGTSSISLSIAPKADYSSLYTDGGLSNYNNYSGYQLEFLNDHRPKTGASYFATDTVAAAAGGVSYGKVDYQQYTSAGFSFNAAHTTATYSGESTVTFFSISGIADFVGTTTDKTKTSIAGIDINSTSGIVTLDKGVLTKTDVYLTDKYTGDNIDYKLALASNVNGVDSLPAYWGISAPASEPTTITLKYNTTEGWALSGTSKVEYTAATTGNSRAVLTGLKANLNLSPAGDSSIDGITVNGSGSAYTITLDKGVLGSQSVSLTDDVADGISYSLLLAGDYSATRSNEYFGVSSVGGTSTTAIYQFNLSEAWALNGTSQIDYIAAKQKQGLFSLSGLKSGLQVSGSDSSIAGINVAQTGGVSNTYTVTLNNSALSAGQIVSLNDLNTGDGINFSLSLAADVRQAQNPSYDFNVTKDGTSSAVTYQLNKTDAWKVVGDSVVYTSEALSAPLFRLEGLSNNLTTGTLSALAGITVTKASVSGASTYYTVTLDNSVLGGMSVQLTDADPSDNYYFSLSLSSNVDTPATIDATANHWDIETAGTSSTATYHYYSLAGYSIVGDSAVYHTKDEHKFITIEGLSAGLTATALSAGITFTEGISAITLTRDVLGNNTVTITDEYALDNADYILALDRNAEVGSISGAALSAVAGGTSLNIIGYLGDHYTLNGTSQVNYIDAISSYTLAAISGLSIASNGTFSGATLSGTTIILDATAFDKKNVTFDTNYIETYSLSLAGNVDNIRDYDEKEWKVTNTTAKYQQGVHVGYTLQDDKKSIKYSDATLPASEFMTITGLSNGAPSTAITFLASGGNSYVVLGDEAIGTTSIFLNATDSAYNNYSLSFANFDDFKRLNDGAEYWTADGTSYTYSKDTSAGFLPISGTSAIYSPLTTENFFTITGLSANLTSGQTEIDYSGKARFGSASGKYSGLSGVNIDGYSITVSQTALAGTSVSLTGGASYTFALNSGVHKPDDYDESKAYGGMYWTAGATSGTFILQYDSEAGYSLDSDSKAINYVDVATTSVATVSGLSTLIVVDTNPKSVTFGKLGTSAGTFTAFDMTISAFSSIADGSKGTVKLTSNLLGGTDVSITSGNYVFSVDAGVTKPTDDATKYWIADTNTDKLTYQYDTGAGYSLGSSSTVLNHYDITPNNVFTIAGLSSSVAQAVGKAYEGKAPSYKLDDTAFSSLTNIGVSFNSASGIITVDARALNGQDVKFETGGTSYTFALQEFVKGTSSVDYNNYYNYYYAGHSAADKYTGNNVPTEARNSYDVTSSKNSLYATAVVKPVEEAYYTIDTGSNSIKYHDESIGSAFATITGLSTSFKDSDLTVGLYVAGTSGASTAISGVISLGIGALGTRKISLSTDEDYKLDIGGASVPSISGNETWNVVKGTAYNTATYKANVTPGHVLALDGKSVTYVAGGQSQTIFKITGLSKDVPNGDGVNLDKFLTINKNKKPPTISLNQDALGTSTISLDATSNTLGYKFELAPKDTDKNFFTEELYANVWRVNGNTAEYKMVILPYYEYNEADNKVIYHAEKDVDGKTYATITGLSSTSGLKADNFGNIGFDAINALTAYGLSANVFTFKNGETKPKPGILGFVEEKTNDIRFKDYNVYDPKDDTAVTGNVIAVSASALNALGKNVQVLSTSSVYTFELDPSLEPQYDYGSEFWSIESDGTATYSKPTGAGRVLQDGNTTIKYEAATDKRVLATVTGLNSAIVVDESTKGIGYKDNSETFQKGIDVSSTNEVTILSDKMLGTTTVTVSDGYKFKLYAAVTEENDAKTANKWIVTSGTSSASAAYSQYKPAYYTLAGSSQINYTAENVDKTPIVTLTGLNVNVVAQDGELGTNENGTFTAGVDIDTNNNIIALKSNVLGASNVTATGSKNFTLMKDESDSTLKTSAEDEYSLKYSNTTATLDKRSSAFYTFNGSSEVKYNRPSDYNTVATITGLKKGLTLDGTTLKSGDTEVVTINTDTSKVTLTAGALDKSTVEVTGDYTLEMDGAYTQPATGKKIWSVASDGTVTLSNGKTKGYTLASDNKTLTYNPDEAEGEPILKITGLKGVKTTEVATADAANYINGIEGITVDSNNVITVSKAVLEQSKDIEITAGDDYTLAIEGETTGTTVNIYGFGDGEATLDGKKKGTLTYTTKTDKGWKVEEGSQKIAFTDEKTYTTTLTGLANKYELAFNEDETQIGYKDSNGKFNGVIAVTDRTLDSEGKVTKGKFELLNSDANVLKTGNATFTSSDQELTFATDSEGKTDSKFNADTDPVWTKSGTNKLIYANNIKAGTYTLSTEDVKDSKGNATGETKTTLVYNSKAADASSPIATLEGLDTSTVTITDGQINGITVGTRNVMNDDGTDKTENVITLDKNVLDADDGSKTNVITKNNTGTVKLTNGKTGVTYVLDIDTESANKVAKPDDGAKVEWNIVSKTAGTATYQNTKQAGYTLTNSSTITYTPETGEKFFTLKGLDLSKLTVDKKSDLDGILLETSIAADGKKTTIITLEEKTLLPTKGKITLTVDDKDKKKNTYKMTVGEDLKIQNVNQQWAISSTTSKGVTTKTATLKAGTSEGYTADKNGTSVTYSAEKLSKTLATIKGLPNVADTIISEEGNIQVDDDPDNAGKYIFTLSANLFTDNDLATNAPKITLTKGTKDGKLAIDDTKLAKTAPTWTAGKNGTVTYVDEYTEDGYVASTDSKTLTWTKTTDKPATLITIKGLDKNAFNGTGTTAADNDATANANISLDGRTVTLKSAVLGTSAITLTGKDKTDTDKYTLTLEDETLFTKRNGEFWTYSGTTAKYVSGSYPYYTQKNKQNLTYVAAGKDKKLTTILTLSNIKSTAKNGSAFTFNDTAKTITLTADALNGKTVTLKGDTASDYKLVLADGVAKPKETTYGFNTKNEYTSKYTLDTGVTGAYVETDDQTVTYVTSTTKATTLFTLKNAKSYKADDIVVDNDAKTITLNENALKDGTANITLTDKAGYKIINSDTIKAPTLSDADANITVTEKNGTGTLKCSVSGAGYYFSDSNTVTYVKKAAYTATIKGLKVNTKGKNTNLEDTYLDVNTNSINVAASDIDTTANKVTADGNGIVGFTFNDFSGTSSKSATIAGGAKNDSITAAGSYVSLNGGAGSDHISVTGSNVTVVGDKGNDFITVESGASVYGGVGNDFVDLNGTGNTFFYAVKDGNDIIADFTADDDKNDDKIKITTSGAKATIKKDGEDAVVTVTDSKDKNAGTITLAGMGSTNFSIYGSDDKVLASYTAPASNPLFDDDNLGTSADLSELVNSPETGSYGNYNTNQNYTDIAPQQQTTAYSGSNKK